jgi:hypothetical protein
MAAKSAKNRKDAASRRSVRIAKTVSTAQRQIHGSPSAAAPE